MLYRRICIIVAGILAVSALTGSAGPGPTPSPSPAVSLNSGTEGAKAALVRIELFALSEIAHVDASTGMADIRRGTSEVPLGSGTGVLVSADGIVATTWENLALDEGTVAVNSANDLFNNVIRVPIVGNDGNPQRRGTTPDEYWAPHLQHCYNLVSHCVLFKVPQYRIRTYTSEPGSVVAELLNKPSNPQDVALLQITGGGGAPTATLAPPGTVPAAGSLLLGFVGQPTPTEPPAQVPVSVDTAAGRIASEQDLGALLDAGISGGPVIDGATGQVLGLAGPRQDDGRAVLQPAAAIQSAMAAAKVEASRSKFDVVFRSGVDHLAAGNQGGSAVSAFEEALTYYDSALAATRLEEAKAMGNQQPTEQPTADGSAADAGVPMSMVLLAALAGVLLLGGIVAALTMRRRKPAVSSGSVHSERTGGRHGPDTGMTTAAGNVGGPAADRGLTTTAAPPGTDRGQAQTPREGAAQSGSEPNRPEQDGADETRAAGPFALRAAPATPEASGQPRGSCSHCGEPVQPGARFCTGCGQPVG
ncbi:zinc ribbon domain-containing protein [[Micrococcus luteus] ATCC 49442]|uniref:zinc ribbon domain-containing protein n=1 Tax=[Micrococcus luteus] ATCC 49442 TaxID=2698727 RepID=UPI0013DB106F|nr:zinc ribbon domain-containing protein [[Micrococcus luteus] ATCC 49442]